VEFGRKYHPERPYDSRAVRVIVDDGRSFFKKSEKKYDLIIMGLADSHTLSSSLTNLRLDHYLYTKESFTEAKKLLKEDGLLVASFDVTRPWIGGRIQKSLTEAFGQSPLIFAAHDTQFFGLGGVFFLTDADGKSLARNLDANPDLKTYITARKIEYDQNLKPLSDNWPYLYLDHPRIPKIHFWVSLLLLIIFLAFQKLVKTAGRFRFDFFFLGAGFLLYEFQNVSKTALLFGNTWVTNLFTISAILVLILLANLLTAMRPMSLKVAYMGLALSFGLQFVLPLTFLNALPFVSKMIFGSLLLNLPLFFSGIIFITLLRESKDKSVAFGSNLIGSAIGGMLEALSFLLGIQALLYMSLALYAGSFIMKKR